MSKRVLKIYVLQTLILLLILIIFLCYSILHTIQIREIEEKEMEAAINLVIETFLKYEAPDYTEEGIEEFKKAVYNCSFDPEK